jgi:hypothetical protein
MASELHVDAIKHSGGTSALTIDSSGNLTANANVHYVGGIVQIQSATLAGASNSTTSTSFTDTGLTLNITPKFATSKILVLVHHAISIQSSTNTRADFRCIENGSSTEIYRLDYHGNDGNDVSNTQRNMSGSGVFQCSNTNQLTFKTQVQKAGPIASEAGNIFFRWYSGSIHTIQALEVAQ